MLRLKFNKKDGKLDLNVQSWSRYVEEIKNGSYVMEIKAYRKKRTMAQNRWYWKVMEIIGDELGYEREELHETFKATYLGEIDEHGLLHSKSTTEQTTTTMTEYMDKIIRFAAKNGILIPDPNDY